MSGERINTYTYADQNPDRITVVRESGGVWAVFEGVTLLDVFNSHSEAIHYATRKDSDE